MKVQKSHKDSSDNDEATALNMYGVTESSSRHGLLHHSAYSLAAVLHTGRPSSTPWGVS